MSVARALLMLMRAGAAVQVVLGVAFWTGHWTSLVPVHMTVGGLYALLLWIIALIALFQRRSIGLALFALLWGLTIPVIGLAQMGILAGGSLHWIVRVIHLAVGLAAMPIAERLAPAKPTVMPAVAVA